MRLFEFQCRGAYFEDAEENACLTFQIPYVDRKWLWHNELCHGKWTEDGYFPISLHSSDLGAIGYRALTSKNGDSYFDIGLPSIGKMRTFRLETKKTFPVKFFEKYKRPPKDGPEFRPNPSSEYDMQISRGWEIEDGQRSRELEISFL